MGAGAEAALVSAIAGRKWILARRNSVAVPNPPVAAVNNDFTPTVVLHDLFGALLRLALS